MFTMEKSIYAEKEAEDILNIVVCGDCCPCRWIVNIQENGGYELEHNYGTVGFTKRSAI